MVFFEIICKTLPFKESQMIHVNFRLVKIHIRIGMF